MKILTIVGTRPELIRLSVIISKLDYLVDHILVYTNQNFDKNLSDIFFKELHIRKPDYVFKQRDGFCSFFSEAIKAFEKILSKEKPDKILILGDTNSGLLSLVASKFNIPIYHMEAGNRCYDSRVPEETNRKIIDAVSTYNLPYTENSKQNLLNEGYHKNYVFKTGNPILEVLNYYNADIESSTILDTLSITTEKYILVTSHRSENVDNYSSLKNIVDALNIIAEKYIIIFSVHPRTASKLAKHNLSLHDNIVVSKPLGFFDFVKLEKHALLVISDSGTCQEEACLFNVPSITIRNSTERQETIECGSNILSGTSTAAILTAFRVIVNRNTQWSSPRDYLVTNVSDIIINILLRDNKC